MPKRSPLYEYFASRGARFARRGEWELPELVSSWDQEYRAAAEAATLSDRSYRARVRAGGRDRQRFLHNMLTNDILALGPGQGVRAALLSRKGRLITDLFVFCGPDDILLEMEPERLSAFTQALSRYIVSEDVKLEDVSGTVAQIAVAGPKAPQLLHRALDRDVENLPRFGFVQAHIDSTPVQVAAVQHGPGPGFDLSVAASEAVDVMEHLLVLGQRLGVRLAGARAMEARRIEAGIGRFGVDMDESNLLLEAHLEDAVSFTKGCYVGQEIVARIAHRGHLNRRLVGLRMAGPTVPRPGDDVIGGDRWAGQLTSTSSSPTLGCAIALGYVQRDFFEHGTALSVRSAQGELEAKVSELPFIQ